MRYRTKLALEKIDLFWICFALLQIANVGDRIYRHKNSGNGFLSWSDIAFLIVWCIILLLYATKPFFAEWRFTADALVFHWFGIHNKKIAYRTIVAVRPQPSAKHPAKLEIETARVSADVYPHNYVVIAPRDKNGFLEALRSHLPPQAFEAV
jgi:hypothetical protein